MDKKRNFMASIFLLVLLLPLSFSACPHGKRQIYLAAVTGEDSGGVFRLDVEVRPGNGTVYTAISPLTGISTQESEQDAVKYAFSSSGADLSECDVLFSISGNFGENKIDGPSAGAAMAAAVKAALTGKGIRQDIVMTGTISPEGRVGEVGGIIEKSLAAADVGASYIVIPKPQLYESFLLSSISQKRDFYALDVANMSQAEEILFSAYSKKFSPNFSPESKPMPPNLPQIKYDSDLARFSLVARKVVEQLDSSAQPIISNPKSDPRLSQYFSDEISKYKELVLLGYPFTAANAAFLLSIDEQYAAIGDRPIDIDKSFQSVEDCLNGVPVPKKTRENFHWATGADLRRLWATSKLNQTAERRADQEGYLTIRDLSFAYSWCGISKDLSQQAGEVGGTPVDESALADLASTKLSEAEEAISSSPAINYDAMWHLGNGYLANESGEYAAAIYEATYAKTMQQVSNEGRENITSSVEKLLTGSRSSLWGKIYYGQGAYIYHDATAQGFPPSDSYGILKYSSELDRVSEEMDKALAASPAPAPMQAFFPSQGRESKDNWIVGSAMAVFLALFSVAFLVRLWGLSRA